MSDEEVFPQVGRPDEHLPTSRAGEDLDVRTVGVGGSAEVGVDAVGRLVWREGEEDRVGGEGRGRGWWRGRVGSFFDGSSAHLSLLVVAMSSPCSYIVSLGCRRFGSDKEGASRTEEERGEGDGKAILTKAKTL